MTCQTCASTHMIGVSAKCDDRFWVDAGAGGTYQGYVPRELGIGGGDYLTFRYCAHCGTIQGVWPLELAEGEPIPDRRLR